MEEIAAHKSVKREFTIYEEPEFWSFFMKQMHEVPEFWETFLNNDGKAICDFAVDLLKQFNHSNPE